ncbi:MAG: hypothetical protein ACTSQY_11265 [Candidatus Odinarchaeia archaeon]
MEFPWPSHERAYNSPVTITFASSKLEFVDGDNFYLSPDSRVKEGNLMTFDVFDSELCEDEISDDGFEDKFCEKFVYGNLDSGISTGTWPAGYRVRNNRYVFVFKTPDSRTRQNYEFIPRRFKITTTNQ